MTSLSLIINDTSLGIKEYQGQRVVTLKDVDTVHKRPEGTARRNFNDNKERFIKNVDYFFVKPADVQTYDFRTSEINNSGTYLLTESGYLMLVKSFTDDLAWDVQRKLVDTYFRAARKYDIANLLDNPDLAIQAFTALKEERKKNKQLVSTVAVQTQQIAELKPKASYYDVVLNCKDLISTSSIAKDYGKSAIWLNRYLHEKNVQFKQGDIWLLYQKYASIGYTSTKTQSYNGSDGEVHTKIHTYWTQKGRLFIYELLKNDGYLPTIEQDQVA